MAKLQQRMLQASNFDVEAVSDLAAKKQEPYTSGSIAVISISGILMKSPDIWERLFFGASDINAIIESIDAAAQDKDVKGIVLKISSPGGTVAGTPELAEAVTQARKKKTVIAYVDDLAASAAYWVASQAESIIANRESVIGSIGVRLMMYDLSEAYKSAGIKAVSIDTGKFKSTGVAGTEITDEQQAMYQEIVDAHFQDFKSAVMSGRGMTEKAFEKVADAQVFHAAKAKSVKLIDKIGSLEDAVKLAMPRGRNTQSAHAKLRLYAASA